MKKTIYFTYQFHQDCIQKRLGLFEIFLNEERNIRKAANTVLCLVTGPIRLFTPPPPLKLNSLRIQVEGGRLSKIFTPKQMLSVDQPKKAN